MPIREAKAWRVYRYQKPDSEQDGKLILALLVESNTLQGVMINSKPARIKPLQEIETLLSLDFLQRQVASIRFDTLVHGSFEEFTLGGQEKNWVVTGRARYQVLNKAISAESRLSRTVKRRLRQENIAFLNHWARQELRSK